MSDAFERADPSGAARAAVFARTLFVQRRRRIVRRAAAAAIVVVAYAAGFATPRPAVMVPASEPAPRAEMQAPTRAPDAADPRELERRASLAANKNERVGLLRAAGDHYLGDRGDIEAALRCYRQFIDAGSNDDLQSDSADSWLLSALKRGGD